VWSLHERQPRHIDLEVPAKWFAPDLGEHIEAVDKIGAARRALRNRRYQRSRHGSTGCRRG
jgi:hypothetical protein